MKLYRFYNNRAVERKTKVEVTEIISDFPKIKSKPRFFKNVNPPMVAEFKQNEKQQP